MKRVNGPFLTERIALNNFELWSQKNIELDNNNNNNNDNNNVFKQISKDDQSIAAFLVEPRPG